MSNVVSVAIVSHGHSGLIVSNSELKSMLGNSFFDFCIVDNVGENELSAWARTNNVGYISNLRPCGFGHNNNQAFSWFESVGRLGKYFLVLNPDVFVDSDSLKCLVNEMNLAGDAIATINLYKDNDKSIHDNSIRRFPTFFDFFSSFYFGKNNSVLNKGVINKPTFVEWAAGSFLMFKSSHYKLLHGFDERYFMYCEDIDICRRSFLGFNCLVRYYPSISAVHFAAHGNRKLFSKHFYWHLKSVFLYMFDSFLLSFYRALSR